MINKIMASSVMPQKAVSNNTPSFGMARLNQKGKDICDELEISRNYFLNPNMYKSAGLFQKPAIIKELGKMPLDSICEKYGCSNNAESNAKFIKTQILKTNLKKLPVENSEISDSLVKLYEHNFDNPELSKKDTEKLLSMVEDNMSLTEYTQHVGLMDIGTV